MPAPDIHFNADGKPATPADQAKLIAFLQSPEGLEVLADAVRKAREWIKPDADASDMEAMHWYENVLRAYSARPLPPELDF